MKPLVSVIVPCRNEEATIAGAIHSILASDYPRDCIEVIAADGRSQDATRLILEQLAAADARLRVIDNPDRITPAALNRAVAAARGRYILRVDAHSVIDPHYLARAVETLEASGPEVWGVGGLMRTEPEARRRFSEAIRVALSTRFGVGNSGFRTGSASGTPRPADVLFNACWRREVFERIGGFNEHLVRSQDIEFSSRIRRAGGVLLLHPEMQSTYFAKASFRGFVRQTWNNGVWALLPVRYAGRLVVSLRHLAPLAFVLALLMGLTGAVLGWGWAPLLVAGPYLAANLGASVAAAATRQRLSLAVLLPVTFAALHLAYGAGSLWGALRLLSLSKESET
jgi:glycosyltransferase involved in cell wall biosynthesis